MPTDPQPDAHFEDDLAHAFSRAAGNVHTDPDAMVTGGLTQGRSRRRRRRIAAIAGTVTALAVIGAGGVVGSALRAPLTTSNALEAARPAAPARLDQSVNILLIGLDSRTDADGEDLPDAFVRDQLHAGSSRIGGDNADTLIVLHLPADGGPASAVSIPRDDYVQAAGGVQGMQPLREVYPLAAARAEQQLHDQHLPKAELDRRRREAGRAATVQTVQQLLGVPIDHFAEFNLLGFYDIAKAVGPIPVCLNNPVSDPIESRVTDGKGNVVKPGGGTGLTLPAGESRLDAGQALSFVRQRHHLRYGDLDRTRRQQAFIAGVLHRLGEAGMFTDPGHAEALYDVVHRDLVVDGGWRPADLARQVPALGRADTVFTTLPISGFDTHHGVAVNTVDANQLRQMVQQQFGATPAATPPVVKSPAPNATSAIGIPCVD